ncbi:MAG: hypothetical protein ACJZ69_03555 [Pelagibacteraceae bacterium]|tara:strand:+ start:27 stop:443 length:417 start_codon:yes stop_codon:yes gene_type:complete
MIDKFNNIFYLIIFLVHFAGVGVYAYQTIADTKRFMKKFGIDKSSAIMIRLAGAFMLAVFLMSIYVGFIRPGGLNATWAFFNLVFLNNLCVFLCNFYSIKINKTGVNKKTGMEPIYSPLAFTIMSGILCYGLANKIYV